MMITEYLNLKYWMIESLEKIKKKKCIDVTRASRKRENVRPKMENVLLAF